MAKVRTLLIAAILSSTICFSHAEIYNALGHPSGSWAPAAGSVGDFDFTSSPGFVEGVGPMFNLHYFTTPFSVLQVGDSLVMTASISILEYGGYVSGFPEDPISLGDGSGVAFFQLEWDSDGMIAAVGFGTFDGMGDLNVNAGSNILTLDNTQIPDPGDPLNFDFNLTLTLTAATEWQLTGSLTANSIESTLLQGPPIMLSTAVLTGVEFYYLTGALTLDLLVSDILVDSGSFGVNAVPEPSVGFLLLAASLLAWHRRRRLQSN